MNLGKYLIGAVVGIAVGKSCEYLIKKGKTYFNEKKAGKEKPAKEEKKN